MLIVTHFRFIGEHFDDQVIFLQGMAVNFEEIFNNTVLSLLRQKGGSPTSRIGVR
jgi:hypothetical protein